MYQPDVCDVFLHSMGQWLQGGQAGENPEQLQSVIESTEFRLQRTKATKLHLHCIFL